MQNIVTISGTSRPNNFTFKALNVVNDEFRKNGIEPSVFDARELSLPFPGGAASDDSERLINAVKNASGVIIASPEYHGTFAAMTKLIIENMGFPSALSGKPVALVGVAAGRIGAIKTLEQLKGVCSHTGAIVIPGAVSIAGVQQIFDEKDQCTDAASEKALRGVAQSLISFLHEYVCPKYALEDMIRDETATPWTSNV